MYCLLLYWNLLGLYCFKNDKVKFLICFLFFLINCLLVSLYCKFNRRMMYIKDVFINIYSFFCIL